MTKPKPAPQPVELSDDALDDVQGGTAAVKSSEIKKSPAEMQKTGTTTPSKPGADNWLFEGCYKH